MRVRHLLLASIAAVCAAGVDARQLRFVYPTPDSDRPTVTPDVQYGLSSGTVLKMDVYRPRTAGALPAIIFFNRAVGAERSNPFYAGWASVAASQGLVGVLPDLRPGHEAEDFRAVAAHLAARGADYGVDPARIAAYAGSGNVSAAFPAVEDPAQTTIRAAVMYYGAADVAEFRRDLPVLYVRAGLDRPPVNRAIADLAARAVAQNAPVTFLNHPTGHHGFEMIDDDPATRLVIDQTIAFVKHATSADYQSSLKRGLAEATAAGYVQMGKFGEAARAYATLVDAHPDNAPLGLAYGEALLGDRQFAAACAQLETLKGKGLGYRDLGLPAARACAQKGDPEAAIRWLESIPARFLPPSVADDPAFVTLKSRPEFQAIFKRDRMPRGWRQTARRT